MQQDNVFRVSQVPSKEWDQAIDHLSQGGATVLLTEHGETKVGLQRWRAYPTTDGSVHVLVWTKTLPSEVTVASARADIQSGLRCLRQMVDADGRLGRLIEHAGATYEYLYDYGHGAAKLGSFDALGNPTLT